MTSIPRGFHRLAPGIRCRCIYAKLDEHGDYWCCGGKPPARLERTDSSGAPPAMSFLDVDLEILARFLRLSEHGIRIERVEASATRPRQAIAIVITGEAVPAGECKATYRQVGDKLVLENLRGADESRRRP
jgi:hypothetical protein